MIEYFNFFYFLYPVLAVGLLIGLYLMLRNKSEKTVAIVLFLILTANFALHFLKLFADFYQERMPWVIRTVTPENICAVSVLLFPWFFLSKNKFLRDYMYYIGIISGVGATIFPIDVIGHNAFEFETLRYYIAHSVIWVIPLLMVMLKVHTLEYRRILKMPLIAFLILGLILVNEVILTGIGFLREDIFFSYEVRNAAFIFGPHPDIAFIGTLFLLLTPEFFTVMPIGENAGETFYWPIVWLMIPFYIYVSIISVLLTLPFVKIPLRR